MGSTIGCACERFAKALREGFVERRDDHFYLGDREWRGAGGWSSQYGPEILFCPFCSHALLAPAAC